MNLTFLPCEGETVVLHVGKIFLVQKYNEMNRALGHFCAHTG